MTTPPYRTILVPIASEADARNTATAVGGRFDDATIVLVYVVEKAGGAPDSAGVEQRVEYARDLFETFESHFEDADVTVESRIAYGTDVAEALLEQADAEGAEVIVFVPRGESRWRQLLSGDVARKLMNRTDRPVLILPDPGDGDE